MKFKHLPKKQGLYDPSYEHDNCGVGFVCNINGKKSHEIINQGIKVLERMSHRGAVGADPKTGDGAGLLIQIPHKFLQKKSIKENIILPEEGKYGTGIIFLPTLREERENCISVIERIVKEEGLIVLGWREVPVDNSIIGKTAIETEPTIKQIFISGKEGIELERKLYIIRRRTEKEINSLNLEQKTFFYINSLSSQTLVYKGLLMPEQVRGYFLDLSDEDIDTALAIVHSRYSTNTFPTWDLSQPFRYLAHNGEINTLRGNINWMKAREALLESDIFGEDIKKLLPVIVSGGSDSATIDNVFELLVLSGRKLEHAMMMLIPEAWEQNKNMDENLKAFYKYHACFMEPWDGPSAIAVTDGKRIGAILDRNGLRPARYIVTKDDIVVMSSEIGVLDLPPSEIKQSGRLKPGKIFFIDTVKGEIIDNDELKKNIYLSNPYDKWVEENMVELSVLVSEEKEQDTKNIIKELKAFGYSREDLKNIIQPMAIDGEEPVGAMGNDAPHALLSSQNQILYNYFKQLFAQVTNPAIDPIREHVVMSIQAFVGKQKNMLNETPLHAHKLRVGNPILSDGEIERIRNIGVNSFKTKTISMLFKVKEKESFMKTLDYICNEAHKAIEEGYTFIILSDKGINSEYAALPALLAVGTVHHSLINKAIRTQIGLIVETADAREVHHLALLFGYGADCINPYLAYKSIRHLIEEDLLTIKYDEAIENYRNASKKGILKILSKMGISTLNSYRGAQIFEAIGIGEEVINRSFSGTASRIGGVNFEDIREETVQRHNEAYPSVLGSETTFLNSGGFYQWKKDGESHLWRPESIAALQDAVRKDDYEKYKEFANLIDDQSKNPTTLRSLLKFKKDHKPISIDKVENVSSIIKRFATGAMSFGSISGSAHEAIAIAMNRLGGKSNTGEGGEDPARFTPLPNGDSKRSAIKQVASGRFGVTTNYLINADEIQIKIAQGAKPGEGGQLPGHKVQVEIARTRYTTPGVTLISPPPHHDIYSIEDLAQLIFDLKNVNPRARISVKLVSEMGVGTIAAGVAKGHADMILISGGDGGTGASGKSSIRHAGLPWELGLSETHQTLVLNDLRSRVRLQTDGQMRTGKDVAVAALLGAEEYGFATAILITIGCVMLRHCNLNNCSVGVATQDKFLEKRFQGRPEYIESYMRFVVEHLREIMAEIGVRTVDELIGMTNLLEINKEIIPKKAKGIDLSRVLYKPKVDRGVDTRCTKEQDYNIDKVLDRKLIELGKDAIERNEKVNIKMEIKNYNRTTGAMLSGEICRVHGEKGLSEDTLHCKFNGVGGQSFGAFLIKGVTFELEGMANDYVGKGISGGKIIIYPDKEVKYLPDENVIIGNTTFYGAIDGEAYINGIAGERFCIRNSGLYAVVEGIGDHGCEYMTGGRVVILGETGRNFGAGMSGGIAYVYDKKRNFKNNCNMDMIELEELDSEDKETVRKLIHNHLEKTGSPKADKILGNFEEEIETFVKVMPIEYKRILEAEKTIAKLDLLEVSDG